MDEALLGGISAIKRFTIHTPIQRKHLPGNFGKRENLAMGTFGIELDKDQGWGQISGECCF